MAASVRRLHRALTGRASELDRYERLAGTARLLVRHASGREPARRGADRVMAARIRELIRASVADPGTGDVSGGELTADDLAAAAGCSRFAAYRAFRQAYGLSPSDYQRQLRVQTARRLLSAGAAPATVAAAAGFADQAHLTRWFRRYYGVTPGAYRAAAGGPAGH